MSNVGVVVIGRTIREIHEEAQKAREKLHIGREGRLALNMNWLLEKLLRPIYGVELDVVEDDDPMLTGAYAVYDCANKIIRMKEKVLRGCDQEDPESIFTICHEVGHACLHSDPKFFRQTLPQHLPARLCDPEWQADTFACEFCIDRKLLEKYGNPVSAADYFRIPLEKMRFHFAQLRSQGVLVPKPITALEKHLGGVQGDFEF